MNLTFQVLVVTSLCFWTCVNFLCMASCSPYSSISKYLLTFFISISSFLFFSNLSRPRSINFFCYILFAANLALILYLITFGPSYRGVKRWILVNGFSYQPSELFKICLPVSLANMFFLKKWLHSILLVSICMLSFLLQPDIGNAILVFITVISMLFFWGVRKRFIAFFILFGVILLGYFSTKVSYCNKRIQSFIHHGNVNRSYQSFRAIQAIEAGGVAGKGPGKGQIKRFIPDAYSDFIFAVIGEEFGLIGCYLIAISFLIFFLNSMFFANLNPNSIEGASIFGIGVIIFLQSWIHMSSVLGIIPTKGITLPFISHGNSSMIASWIGVGIMMAMSRNLKAYRRIDSSIVNRDEGVK